MLTQTHLAKYTDPHAIGAGCKLKLVKNQKPKTPLTSCRGLVNISTGWAKKSNSLILNTKLRHIGLYWPILPAR